MIHVIPPLKDPYRGTYRHMWEVWTDTEVSLKDGRCIGLGKTREEAIENARNELQEDLDQLEAARWGVAADTE